MPKKKQKNLKFFRIINEEYPVEVEPKFYKKEKIMGLAGVGDRSLGADTFPKRGIYRLYKISEEHAVFITRNDTMLKIQKGEAKPLKFMLNELFSDKVPSAGVANVLTSPIGTIIDVKADEISAKFRLVVKASNIEIE